MGRLFKVQFNAAAQTVVFPKKILEEQCTYLNEDTDGIIIGRVVEYSGTLEKDKYMEREGNIQAKLGEIGKDSFTYEFFLTSKGTPDYKFRVMFLQYDITGYPLTIILEEGISNEIHHSEGIFDYFVKDQKAFEELLGKIMNSNRFMELVTRLIQLNNC